LLRNGTGGEGQRQPATVEVAVPDPTISNDNDDLIEDELDVENGDDVREDAAALFDIDLDDGGLPIDADDVDGDGGGGTATVTGTGTGSTSTHGTSHASKRKSGVWVDFDVVKEGDVRIAAICKMCKTRLSARSTASTGLLIRHQNSCRKKKDHANRDKSRIALNPDGLHNWVYDPAIAHTELCHLIARLDLPLCIGETWAWEDYIKRAHNPLFSKVSRQTTTRDLSKLFVERRDVLKNSVLPAAHFVSLTSDIWSGNDKEDYISVVAHYVSADWELHKRIVGFKLINVKHSGENIAETIASIVEEFGLIDKVFAITLDNVSSNAKAMETLTHMFFGYLGSYPAPTPSDPNKVKYFLVHQCCACHTINLILKSRLKRLKPFTEDLRTAISFLNSSNQRIALFKEYCMPRVLDLESLAWIWILDGILLT
jgi:hypothetical protein